MHPTQSFILYITTTTPTFTTQKISSINQISSMGAIHKLVIDEADDRDMGKYSCHCRQISTEATLTITAPPKITNLSKYQDTILLHTNKSVIVEVPFTSSPQPDVEWTYNGGRLPDVRRTTVETIWGMTALTINRAYRY